MKERKNMNKKDFKRSLFPYIFLLIFILACLVLFKTFNSKVNELSYDEFMKNLNGGKITELTITPKVRTKTYELVGKLDEYKENESFILYLPYSDEFVSKIIESKDNETTFDLTVKTDPEASSWLEILVDVVPIVILAGVTIWIFTRQLGSGN